MKINKDRLVLLPVILEKYKDKITVDVVSGEIIGLKAEINHKGYKTINFWVDGKKKYYRHHEVIAYKAGLELLNKTVNHKNGIKTDNRIDNLETVSALDNHALAKEQKLFLLGSKSPSSKLTERQVNSIRNDYTGRYGEQTKIVNRYNVDKSTISNIIRRKTWSHI